MSLLDPGPRQSSSEGVTSGSSFERGIYQDSQTKESTDKQDYKNDLDGKEEEENTTMHQESNPNISSLLFVNHFDEKLQTGSNRGHVIELERDSNDNESTESEECMPNVRPSDLPLATINYELETNQIDTDISLFEEDNFNNITLMSTFPEPENFDLGIPENFIVLEENPNVAIEILDENEVIIGDTLNESHTSNKTSTSLDGDNNNANQILEETNFENKKKRPKKRKANPELWERNIRKKQRLSGKSYVTAKGKEMPEKVFNCIDNCHCRFKCHANISTEQQKILFEEYYSFADDCRQKAFLSSLVVEKPIQRHRKRNPDVTGKEKKKSRSYFLPDANKEKHRVCLKFFCNVFQMSFQVIDLALIKSSSSGVYTGVDGRKGRPAPNATKPEIVCKVKEHINSFPRTEAHYCRKHSKKLYLSPELNLKELYRLYTNEFCPKENIREPVKEGVYRSIFNSYEPPLATFVPKKDQCSKCNQYNSTDDKSSLEEEYRIHVRRKTEAMDMKSFEMNEKVENKITATFDLQAVLSVPFAGDAQIYYKRKLSVYNFTIFDSNKEGFCYVWDESNGMKGSSEIGTGLILYMTNLPKDIKHVVTYSDSCGGQNRNQFIASAMMYVVNNTQIETVDLKFLESGHTYLEADAMHATIERARKHKKVYTTEEWALVIEMSRKKPKPYSVKILKYSDIFDLTSLGKQLMQNRTKNTKQETVNWLRIKWLRFQKATPFVISYKYELQTDLEFKSLDVRMNCETQFSWEEQVLSPKYNQPIPISKAKKKDLMYLLKTGVIPQAYTHYISSIPTSDAAKDIVPYVVEEEQDNSTDETDGNEQEETTRDKQTKVKRRSKRSTEKEVKTSSNKQELSKEKRRSEQSTGREIKISKQELTREKRRYKQSIEKGVKTNKKQVAKPLKKTQQN